MSRRLEEGANRRQLYGHIVRRLLVLFLLGLLCNGPLDLNLHTLRIPGVLQRIAVCHFLAALVVMNTSIRAQAWVAGGILVVYWVILKLVPVPGFGAGVFTQEGNLAGYIDRLILPQASRCYFFGDNEGVLSTLPAVATRLLGVLAGHWLRSKNSPQRKALGLALGGVSSLLLGLVWGFDFPINKILWTSSYVLTAGGWSLLLLALFYWIIDVRGFERWSFFFKVIGMNAITIYVVHNIYAPNHVHLSGLFANIFLHGIMRYLGPAQPLVWACGVVTTMWLFLYFLYRQKIFLRV
jgi:predicted acyltransferase